MHARDILELFPIVAILMITIRPLQSRHMLRRFRNVQISNSDPAAMKDAANSANSVMALTILAQSSDTAA